MPKEKQLSKTQLRKVLNQRKSQQQQQVRFANTTAFRQAEREFKSRIPEPDYTRVIDFSNIENNTAENQTLIIPIKLNPQLHDLDPHIFESKPNIPAYTLKNHPGLIFIPNPLTNQIQKDILTKSLCEYQKSPNKTNLDPFYNLPTDRSLFSIFQDAHKRHEPLIQPITSETDKEKNVSVAELVPKLRWTTIGKQYNWTTKQYEIESLDGPKYEIPIELDKLARLVSIAITNTTTFTNNDHYHGGDVVCNEFDGYKFKSQAGIINYYGIKDTLNGHVDKTENNMDAPLISISLGCTGVFLLGGKSKDIPPTPLFLKSGDIMAMCGPSRSSFHGVPRIIESTCPDYLTSENNSDIADYISEHRINLNIRQCD